MHHYDVDDNLYFDIYRGSGKSWWGTPLQYFDPSYFGIDKINTVELKWIYDTMKQHQDNIDSLIDGYRCAATLYDDTNIVNQTLEQEAQGFEEFMREFW